MSDAGSLPFRLANQEVEKSIVYELPHDRAPKQHSTVGKKYAMKQEIKLEDTSNRFLCLNCNSYIRKEEVDEHSLSHVRLVR